MYFKHKLFGFIFNFFRIFPLKSNQITFIIDKKESFKGNYEYIIDEFNRHDSNYNYTFFIKNQFSFINFYHLAISKYIFLNDNFFPIAFMNFNKDTKIIQLWHAPGAFKKFGYSILNDQSRKELLSKMGEKTSYLTVTSHNIIKFYSEAFCMNENKILPFGIPRTDYYSKNNIDNINKLRSKFEDKYPQVKNKKIVLYAPTFRENPKYNNVFNFFDVEEFNKELSEDYILIVRLHPKIDKFIDNNHDLFKVLNSNNVINCTDYKNEQELLLLSDILITDYSSIMIEFSFLKKPCIFFSYDLNEYEEEERGFYFDYKSNLPGPIVYNTQELINTIKNFNLNNNKIEDFVNYQFDFLDANSSKRIVDFLLKN